MILKSILKTYIPYNTYINFILIVKNNLKKYEFKTHFEINVLTKQSLSISKLKEMREFKQYLFKTADAINNSILIFMLHFFING